MMLYRFAIGSVSGFRYITCISIVYFKEPKQMEKTHLKHNYFQSYRNDIEYLIKAYLFRYHIR